MTEKTDCKHRMKLVQFNYHGNGCESHEMVGFACLAFAFEDTVVWMCGTDDCMCECYESRGEVND